MKVPPKRNNSVSIGHPAWWLADELWTLDIDYHDYVGIFASLVLLRLTDHEEGELAALVGLNGTPIQPSLPIEAAWDRICSLPRHHLAGHLEERVWPRLLQSPDASGLLQLVPTLAKPSKLPTDMLAKAVEIVNNSTDLLAIEFESILEPLIVEEDGFGTDGELLREFMVSLASAKPGETIYQPRFGLGGLLVEAAHRLHSKNESTSTEACVPIQQSNIFGVEANQLFCLIAGVRLMLAGVKKPHLRCDNFQKQAAGNVPSQTFDCILADIPLGMRIESQVSSHDDVVLESREALAFQHILGALKPGGRAVVCVPQSFLFRQGEETRLRERLLTEFRLDAVVALPTRLNSARRAPCSLLVVHRQSPRQNVLFINVSETEFILENSAKESLRWELLLLALRVRQGIAGTTEEVELLLRGLMTISQTPNPDVSPTSGQTDLYSAAALASLIEHLLHESSVPVPQTWKKAFVSLGRLSQRGWELLEKEDGLERLDDFLKRIKKALPDMDIRPLRDCAEVMVGVSCSGTESQKPGLSQGETVAGVNVVRVQDLIRIEERARGVPILWAVIKNYPAREGGNLAERNFLLENDVVLSISGTVGKVALAGKGVEKTVVSEGIAVIRCSEYLLANYIASLLLTDPYQEWFTSQSTGNVVRQLPIAALSNLPIAVAPEAAQLTVLKSESRKSNEYSFLNLISQREDISPWLDFLIEDRDLQAFNKALEDGSHLKTSLPLLSKFTESGYSLIERALETRSADPVALWLQKWTDIVLKLERLLGMRQCLTLYTLLKSWISKFNTPGADHSKALENVALQRHQGPNALLIESALEVIRRLNANLIILAKGECLKMIEPIELSTTVSPSIINAEREHELTIAVKNESVLPLASVYVHAMEPKEFEGIAETPVLAPGETVSGTFKLAVQPVGILSVSIAVFASKVDLSRFSGGFRMAVEVQNLDGSAIPPRLEKSPYVVGSPIDPKSKMFFGRDDVIDKIKRALRTEGPSTVILLEGNRRVGKSSLLKLMTTSGLSLEWLPVYVNFQGFDGTSGKPGMATGEIFYGIAKELAVAAARFAPALRLPGIDGAIPMEEGMSQTAFFIRHLRPIFSTGSPFECFRLVVEAVLEAIAPCRVLLMLDEFDKVQEGIDSGITSPQLPENLRNLFHTYDRVSGILTGSRTIRRLRQEYWSVLFGLGIPIAIKGLDEAAARRLVTEPVKGQLVYASAAVDYVVNRCARQPFLVQGLCHSIFELCSATEERSVTVELASKAADRYAQDNEHFRTVWDQIQSNRRQYLVCLVDQLDAIRKPIRPNTFSENVQLAEQRTPVTMELLRDTLEQRGVQYRAVKQLIEDLDQLVAFEILGTEGDQRERTYRIEIPIFSDWLRRNVDSEAHRLEAQNELE